MRKIVVLEFISLDGVIQAPGGRQEDASGGFEYGGWTVPYFDEASGSEMDKQMSQPFDLLLGRKTYDIFAGYWPAHIEDWKGLEKATKYVVSNNEVNTSWDRSVQISGDIVTEIQKLKQQEGPMLQVYGSSVLAQTLLSSDLVDELWLKTFPVLLGKGKRLFNEDVKPAAFKLVESVVTPSGVIFASYARDGDVRTGDFS